VSYVSTYRPSLSIKLRVEVPHYVPLNRDFIRNDMAIKWLPWGRSGDSQIKASKMLTGVSNRHFFPCCPQNAMSSRAIARDLLILQLSSHICNFATSSLVPPKCMSSRAAARDLLILQLSSHICNFATSSLVPPKCMSSRAIARDLLILQLSSHICNFATSSLVSLICHVIPSGSEGSPYSSDTFTLFQLHPFVLIAPVCISFYLENFSSGACS
jgi:hypothetical protein